MVTTRATTATRATAKPRATATAKPKPKARIVTKKSMAGLTQFNGTRDNILRRIGFKTFDDFTAAIRQEYNKPKYPKNFEGWNMARDAVLRSSGVKGYRGLMDMAREENAAFAHMRPGAFKRATAGRSPTKPRVVRPRATATRAPASRASVATSRPRAVRPRA
jgi:hypothetical protein